MKATDTCSIWKWWQITYCGKYSYRLFFFLVYFFQLNTLFYDVTSISLTQCPWHHWQSRAQHQDWDTVSNYLFKNDKQHLNDKWDCWREHKEKQRSRWKRIILKRHILQIEPKAIYCNILLVLLTSVTPLHMVLHKTKMIQEKKSNMYSCAFNQSVMYAQIQNYSKQPCCKASTVYLLPVNVL